MPYKYPQNLPTKSTTKIKTASEKMKAVVVLAAVLMVVVVIFKAEQGQAGVSCGQVDTSLAPCLQYLAGGAKPSPACCTGVKNLKDSTPTTEDRQEACKCLKDAASRYSIKPDKARQLPNECGVDVGVPITPDIDCNKIN